MGGSVSSPLVDVEVVRSVRKLEHYHASDHQQQDAGCFVRKQECTQLVRALAGQPSRVSLLLGPKCSGKSQLLLHLKQIWQSPCNVRQVFAPFLLINLHECLITRDNDYGSAAEGLFCAIKCELNAWLDMAEATLANSKQADIAGIPRESCIASLLIFSQSFRNGYSWNLISLIDLLQVTLKHNIHVRPVIVLDEAHVLKSWCRRTTLYDEVQKLAQFFLWLCKDKGRGHTVMATSAPFFWSWLSDTLEVTHPKMMAVGYLSESDAKQLVVDHIIPAHELASGVLPVGGFNEDVWKAMYQVTGGSPHMLKMVVEDAIELGSWTDAMEAIVAGATEELQHKLLETARYEKFSHGQGIVGAIVRGGGLASFDEIVLNVFEGDELKGRTRINEFAEKGIVHVRLWTRGMKYMDVVDEKRGDDTLYLMAADPSYFAAMQQLYPAWFDTAKKPDEGCARRGRSSWGEGDLGASGGEWDYE